MFEDKPAWTYYSSGEAPAGKGQVIMIMSSVGLPLAVIVSLSAALAWIKRDTTRRAV